MDEQHGRGRTTKPGDLRHGVMDSGPGRTVLYRTVLYGSALDIGVRSPSADSHVTEQDHKIPVKRLAYLPYPILFGKYDT